MSIGLISYVFVGWRREGPEHKKNDKEASEILRARNYGIFFRLDMYPSLLWLGGPVDRATERTAHTVFKLKNACRGSGVHQRRVLR